MAFQRSKWHAFLRGLFGKVEKEEAGKSEFVLFLIPDRKYKTELLNVIRNVSKNCAKIIYISLNKLLGLLADCWLMLI